MAVLFLGVYVFLICVMSVFITLTEMGVISKETLKTILFFEGVLNETFLVILTLILVAVILVLYWIIFKKGFYIGIPTKLRKNMEYDNFGNILAAENQ